MKNDAAPPIYQARLDQLRFQAELLWEIFGIFLIGHSIFLAFVLQSAFAPGSLTGNRPGTFVAGIAGFILCVPWATSFVRHVAYYNLRKALAQEVEPLGWDVVGGRIVEITKTGKTIVAGETIPMHWIGRNQGAKGSAALMIVFFVMIYVTVIATSGPWW